jgi:hypothetical protein
MRSSVRLSLLCGLLSLGACADFHRGSAPDAGPDVRLDSKPAPVDDPVFENTVHPTLQNMCAACHFKGNEAQNTRYVLTKDPKDDRAMVVDLTFPADPEGSVLLRKGRGENHQGGIRLPADGLEYPVVRDWIAGLAAKP